MKLSKYWKALYLESLVMPRHERAGWLLSGLWSFFWRYESWWLAGWALGFWVIYQSKNWLHMDFLPTPLVFVVGLLAYNMKPWRANNTLLWMTTNVLAIFSLHLKWETWELLTAMLAFTAADWVVRKNRNRELTKRSRQ